MRGWRRRRWSRRGPAASKLWDAFADRSTDGGRTWQPSELVPLDHAAFVGPGLIQPTLWESAPGCVHMLLRSSAGAIYRSDSNDFGRVWSPAYRTALPNNNSGIDLAKLADGTLVLAHNPVNVKVRTPLSLVLSRDNGQSWTDRLDLETDPGGGFAYPAVIATAAAWPSPIPGTADASPSGRGSSNPGSRHQGSWEGLMAGFG